MDNCKVIAVTNQKGGVGKTTTTVNLGAALKKLSKNILLIDADPQGSLTVSLGVKNPDSLDVSLATVMQDVIEDRPFHPHDGIIRHTEGMDLMPSNIELSGLETALFNVMSRESILKSYVNRVKGDYDYVLIDCMPSLGMMTINALTAADSVIIPVQAQYLPAKGMTQLMRSIDMVRNHTNENLKIEGILMTLVDGRTNLAKDVINAIRTNYGMNIRIFDSQIPIGVKAAEASKTGKSIFAYDSECKPAKAYEEFTREVMSNAERQRKRDKASFTR